MTKIYKSTTPTEKVALPGEYGECKACGSRGTEHPCWFCGNDLRFITSPVLPGGEQIAQFPGNSRWFRPR